MAIEAEGWALPRSWSRPEEASPAFIGGIALWLALIQVSIAASQIVLGLLIGIWALLAWKGAVKVPRLPVDGAFALYASCSVLAALFSFDPVESLQASKKLLLLIVPYLLVSAIHRKSTVDTLVLVLIVMADIGALVGLWQYQFGDLGDLNHRIRGFMSHYMTYSGLLMGVGVLALAKLLFDGRHRGFLIASLGVIGLALLLSLTRSAWIGMAVAACVLAFLRNKKLLLLAPLVILTLALVLPRDVERRLRSFATPDTSSWDRMYMVEAGAAMVANHPWLGVGPNMVAEVYPVYVPAGAPQRNNPHLHNNPIQIAAERGLPCVLAWLGLVGVAFFGSMRSYRRLAGDAGRRALAAGAMGVLLSGFVAGLFEYNFGDSEFQMLFLFAMAIPWMVDRDPTSNPDGMGA